MAGIINKFKRKYGMYMLNKESTTKTRTVVACNLAEAKSIGIIYNSTDVKNIEIIKKFVNELKGHVAEVLSLGFVDKKELDSSYLQPSGFWFFSRKSINWYGKPVEPDVVGFMDKQFDILIDLNFDDLIPLYFVVAKSKAGFKVGKYSEPDNNIYDLTIDTGKDNNSIPYFIDQLKVYLNMIKTR